MSTNGNTKKKKKSSSLASVAQGSQVDDDPSNEDAREPDGVQGADESDVLVCSAGEALTGEMLLAAIQQLDPDQLKKILGKVVEPEKPGRQ